MSKLVCNIPFNTLTHAPVGFQTCCFHNMDVIPNQSAAEFWSSDIMQKLRNGFIDGEPIDQCKECIAFNKALNGNVFLPPPNFFAAVVPSEFKREGREACYEDFLTEDMVQVNPTLDPVIAVMNISNKCNLACRSCSPFLSDTQAAFRRKAGFSTTDKYCRKEVDSFIDELNQYPSLREVVLVGGEPMLDPVFLELLQKLRKDLSIRVQCNGTIYNPEFIEEMCKFRSALLGFSLDGDKRTNEYMRTNVRQEVWWKNVKKSIAYGYSIRDDFKVGFTSVLSNVSAFALRELAEEIMREIDSDIWGNGFISFNHIVINYPRYFRVTCLDNEGRARLLKKLKSDSDWFKHQIEIAKGSAMFFWRMIGVIDGIISLLKAFPPVESDIQEFREFNRRYDKLLASNKNNLIKSINID